MDETYYSNETSVPPRFEAEETAQDRSVFSAAFRLLLQANFFAADTGRDLWDFAIEIGNLKQAGFNDSHFRWLVCKGFVEHGEEVTVSGQRGRSFRRTAELMFCDATCFVITLAGVEYSSKLFHGERSDVILAETGKTSSANHEDLLPLWDSNRHELSLGGQLVKRFKHKSVNQETILAAFAEEGWPASIQDPLPGNGDTDPKRRLNDTIKGLNHHQQSQLIRFRGDGSGEGVIWERVYSSKGQTS